MPTPGLWSLAFEDLPDFDYADVAVAVIPAHAGTDPAAWAHHLFSPAGMPRWVATAMRARQRLVPLLGIPPAARGAFAVRRVVGDEALIAVDDRHLDVRIGVGVDAGAGLARVVTAVRLKGWRGRVYFTPVRWVHPLVVHAMLRHTGQAMAAARPR